MKLHRFCVDGHEHSDAATGRSYLDWAGLLRQSGLHGAPPHFLKMDVEGAETELLPSMLRSGLMPPQIALELHAPAYFTSIKDEARYGAKPSSKPWYDRLASVGALALLLEALWLEGGYTVVTYRLNKRYTSAAEILLARR